MLKSYKWMVWKSLKAPILRAPFCGANKSSNWAIVVVGVEIKVESSQQQWCYSIIVGVEIKVATSSRSRKKVVTGQQQFNSGSKNLSRRLPIVVVLQYYRRSRNKSSNWPKVVRIVRHSSPRRSSPQTFITPYLNSDIHPLRHSSPPT